VVDDRGRLCGIVSQADIARVAPAAQVGHLVHDVSKPTDHPSHVQ
jgi:CBS-domain-containing membrane protein